MRVALRSDTHEWIVAANDSAIPMVTVDLGDSPQREATRIEDSPLSGCCVVRQDRGANPTSDQNPVHYLPLSLYEQHGGG